MTFAPESFLTERIIIRRIKDSDLEEIFLAYASDPHVARYMVWPVAKTKKDLEGFVKGASVAFENGEAFEYVVILKESAAIIGGCGMQRVNEKHFTFGYCFAKTSWGQGFATECTKTITNWFNNQPSIYRLSATVDLENLASCRVVEKAGFLKEGILRRWIIHPNIEQVPRDIFMYSIVK